MICMLSISKKAGNSIERIEPVAICCVQLASRCKKAAELFEVVMTTTDLNMVEAFVHLSGELKAKQGDLEGAWRCWTGLLSKANKDKLLHVQKRQNST